MWIGSTPMNEYLAVFFVPSTLSSRKHSPGNSSRREAKIEIGSSPFISSMHTLVVRCERSNSVSSVAALPEAPKGIPSVHFKHKV